MKLKKNIILIFALTLVTFFGLSSPAFAENKPPAECKSVEEKKIKAEGYISKSFKKDRKKIYKEFAELGNTITSIRPFFMKKTSQVVAVGRCVPAYLARHLIKTALKYTSGINSLVNQTFLPTHWVGVATTTFDEPSQQIITPEQLERMLDPSLNDEQFHALYREFSIQDEMVPFFGLQRPNAKKVR
ncbi:MAG: hypothetical protein ACQ9MH_05365 [Nitrospinales bacterium]